MGVLMSDDRMWGGRFSEPPDSLLLRVNASIGFDCRLLAQDILGSIAHARMLGRIGLLSSEQAEQMEDGLIGVLNRFVAGEVEYTDTLEDIHTHVEHELRDVVGADLVGRLHAGRSRNDQVALDELLWLRDAVSEIRTGILKLTNALVSQAEANATVPLVGLTHLQAAQPVTVGHHLLAHTFPLVRDEERFGDLQRRNRFCPLGSGSLAGSPLPLDREYVAETLGFAGGPTRNSMDSVADRDLLVEFQQVSALVGVHLSRLAEDLISWAAPTHGYINLPDACCTGSSLMPQKKNPDALELVRGKSARLIGNAVQMQVMLKALPMAYNKDLQEDKEALFDSFDVLRDCLALATLCVAGMEVVEERCRETVMSDPHLLATDLADYLVSKGVPFRQAHEVVGAAVAQAEKKNCGLVELELSDLSSLHSAFEEDVEGWLDIDASLRRRTTRGGPAPSAVSAEAKELAADLKNRMDSLQDISCPLLTDLAGAWPDV